MFSSIFSSLTKSDFCKMDALNIVVNLTRKILDDYNSSKFFYNDFKKKVVHLIVI